MDFHVYFKAPKLDLKKIVPLFSHSLFKTYYLNDDEKVNLSISNSSDDPLWGKIWITTDRRLDSSLCDVNSHSVPYAYFDYNQKQYKLLTKIQDTFGNVTMVYEGYDLRNISLLFTSWLMDHEKHCPCTFFLTVRGEIVGQPINVILPFKLKRKDGKSVLQKVASGTRMRT
jgi:hypothetical protein